ncbi:acetyl-CoA carboxylase biotin carboxylase subunit [Pseudomonas sp. v388]|uniref:acetyl-CoA carboxylase biotin carboxylase subunit n=1 Tax=Pseudomonas sp. v388 TaxID=2479849 RepID=UPI000F7AB921|nr:biotin carboxylase N-terminal domain-containing protein [Pseudomonas sp. v388]RRV10514.1 acetyl-CoA carboxylase biotin carboxylase subunit [Pseudomonas sp. v388]
MTQQKLLVANRGEIACRVIRSAKSLGIPTVAVYSEADATSQHVKAADEAFLLGPAKASESYLDANKVLEVAKANGVTLVHPGYGFLSENTAFSDACSAAGIVFIGPTAAVIKAMGDKQRSRHLAIEAGVPVQPAAENVTAEDPEALIRAAAVVGYPLLVKASAGGGGIGLKPVYAQEQLVEAVASTQRMAERAFGDSTVFLEKLILSARHIEVQIFGFGNGKAVHLFERDCSIQRRYQKVLEESPAPRVPRTVISAMAAAAVRLAEACRYDGAGTVEFLYDDETQSYAFLEMNTRIQVEHPVTEAITDVDLVAAQIRHALGEDLSQELAQDLIAQQGHAIEARIYAETPERKFMPAPGLIEGLELPVVEGVRIDSGFVAGDRITPFYDPMVMKIIAHGADRHQAVERLGQALRKLQITGLRTNREFLLRVLECPAYVETRVHTRFIDEHADTLFPVAQPA